MSLKKQVLLLLTISLLVQYSIQVADCNFYGHSGTGCATFGTPGTASTTQNCKQLTDAGTPTCSATVVQKCIFGNTGDCVTAVTSACSGNAISSKFCLDCVVTTPANCNEAFFGYYVQADQSLAPAVASVADCPMFLYGKCLSASAPWVAAAANKCLVQSSDTACSICEGGFTLLGNTSYKCANTTTAGLNGDLFATNDAALEATGAAGTPRYVLSAYDSNAATRTLTLAASSTSELFDRGLKAISIKAVSTTVGITAANIAWKHILAIAFYMNSNPGDAPANVLQVVVKEYAEAFSILCSAGGDWKRFQNTGAYSPIIINELLALLSKLRTWTATTANVVTDLTFIQIIGGAENLMAYLETMPVTADTKQAAATLLYELDLVTEQFTQRRMRDTNAATKLSALTVTSGALTATGTQTFWFLNSQSYQVAVMLIPAASTITATTDVSFTLGGFTWTMTATDFLALRGTADANYYITLVINKHSGVFNHAKNLASVWYGAGSARIKAYGNDFAEKTSISQKFSLLFPAYSGTPAFTNFQYDLVKVDITPATTVAPITPAAVVLSSLSYDPYVNQLTIASKTIKFISLTSWSKYVVETGACKGPHFIQTTTTPPDNTVCTTFINPKCGKNQYGDTATSCKPCKAGCATCWNDKYCLACENLETPQAATGLCGCSDAAKYWAASACQDKTAATVTTYLGTQKAKCTAHSQDCFDYIRAAIFGTTAEFKAALDVITPFTYTDASSSAFGMKYINAIAQTIAIANLDATNAGIVKTIASKIAEKLEAANFEIFFGSVLKIGALLATSTDKTIQALQADFYKIVRTGIKFWYSGATSGITLGTPAGDGAYNTVFNDGTEFYIREFTTSPAASAYTSFSSVIADTFKAEFNADVFTMIKAASGLTTGVIGAVSVLITPNPFKYVQVNTGTVSDKIIAFNVWKRDSAGVATEVVDKLTIADTTKSFEVTIPTVAAGKFCAWYNATVNQWQTTGYSLNTGNTACKLTHYTEVAVIDTTPATITASTNSTTTQGNSSTTNTTTTDNSTNSTNNTTPATTSFAKYNKTLTPEQNTNYQTCITACGKQDAFATDCNSQCVSDLSLEWVKCNTLQTAACDGTDFTAAYTCKKGCVATAVSTIGTKYTATQTAKWQKWAECPYTCALSLNGYRIYLLAAGLLAAFLAIFLN